MPGPNQAYHDSRKYELVIFDVSDVEAAKSLHLQRAALQEDGDLEALDENHFVLVVRPGGARRLAA